MTDDQKFSRLYYILFEDLDDQQRRERAWTNGALGIYVIFFQHTPTYCELNFTHQYRAHATDLVENESLHINVYVLICLTKYFGSCIKTMYPCDEMVLEMPFGTRVDLEEVMKLVTYCNQVEDFGDLIECVEFC